MKYLHFFALFPKNTPNRLKRIIPFPGSLFSFLLSFATCLLQAFFPKDLFTIVVFLQPCVGFIRTVCRFHTHLYDSYDRVVGFIRTVVGFLQSGRWRCVSKRKTCFDWTAKCHDFLQVR